MPRKIKQYTNPFLKAKEPLATPTSQKLPNLQNAIALHQQGQLGQAESIYRQLLGIDPTNADALHLLGVIAHQTGNHQIAVDLISQAIEINHTDESFYLNLGNALKSLTNFDAAVASYDKAIYLRPDYAEAYSNRGVALKGLKQFDAAVASYDKAIALSPNLPEAYSNRGIALQELKQLDAASASYEKAIALRPDYAEAYSNRGSLLSELKKFDAAVASYDKAIALKPDYAEAYSNRGIALQELKQLDAASASYEKAIALRPDYAEAYSNMGNALTDLMQLDAAIACYEKANTLKPDFEYLFGTRLHLKMLMCDWQDFELNILELIRKVQNGEKSSPSFPILALPLSLPYQRKVAEVWSEDKHPYNPSLGPILKSARKTRIRIGYYSADFHNHATSYLMAELFELHDKSKFELIAFSFGPDLKDEMRSRVSQAFNQFIDITTVSDKSVAQLSRELGIDIAVDLKGLTKNSRLGIFSYKAAPIQVSYLGYPGTLGADYIDYLIADKTLIPRESQEHYTEKIVYLPNSYQVNDRHRVIAPTQFTKQDLGLPRDSFVFCCFNNNYKITPDVFDSWVRILEAVDTSVLWLLEDNQTAAANLRKEASLRGLDPARLVFAKHMDLPEHLARHKAADLFLDTLPCSAHTTASDALWAGLPVLTCMGESFASRVAASLLFAIGLPELVTETTNEYEALAIELATNPAKLKAIKDKLASNRLTTPLFNTALFTKHIEVAYTEMYERNQADLFLDHIYIKDLDTLP
jgi:predicted O-linked N-acetylglucosamine transferase (SPINDLY family)